MANTLSKWAFVVLALTACSSSSSVPSDAGGADGTTHACTPGQSVACVGVGGCNGGQVCASDGSGYGACQCGASDGGARDGGASDTGIDGATSDAGGDAPGLMDAGDESHQILDSGQLICGAQVCSAGTECCSAPVDGGSTLQCMASCPDGGAPFACDSPQQCPPNMNACCGTIQLTGTFPACGVSFQSSACATSCSINVMLTCPAIEQVQFCAQKADCTDPNNGNCCTLMYRGLTETFCLSNQDAQVVMQFGGQCLQ